MKYPEFKVGDWITYDEDKYGSGSKEVVQIEEIKYSNYWNEECAYWNGGNSSLPLSKIRHATPEEITEKKERRWWAKHGRKPWELRDSDFIENQRYREVLKEIRETLNDYVRPDLGIDEFNTMNHIYSLCDEMLKEE